MSDMSDLTSTARRLHPTGEAAAVTWYTPACVEASAIRDAAIAGVTRTGAAAVVHAHAWGADCGPGCRRIEPS